eukprot:2662657-Rhodomonas_salina.2
MGVSGRRAGSQGRDEEDGEGDQAVAGAKSNAKSPAPVQFVRRMSWISHVWYYRRTRLPDQTLALNIPTLPSSAGAGKYRMPKLPNIKTDSWGGVVAASSKSAKDSSKIPGTSTLDLR